MLKMSHATNKELVAQIQNLQKLKDTETAKVKSLEQQLAECKSQIEENEYNLRDCKYKMSALQEIKRTQIMNYEKKFEQLFKANEELQAKHKIEKDFDVVPESARRREKELLAKLKEKDKLIVELQENSVKNANIKDNKSKANCDLPTVVGSQVSLRHATASKKCLALCNKKSVGNLKPHAVKSQGRVVPTAKVVKKKELHVTASKKCLELPEEKTMECLEPCAIEIEQNLQHIDLQTLVDEFKAVTAEFDQLTLECERLKAAGDSNVLHEKTAAHSQNCEELEKEITELRAKLEAATYGVKQVPATKKHSLLEIKCNKLEKIWLHMKQNVNRMENFYDVIMSKHKDLEEKYKNMEMVSVKSATDNTRLESQNKALQAEITRLTKSTVVKKRPEDPHKIVKMYINKIDNLKIELADQVQQISHLHKKNAKVSQQLFESIQHNEVLEAKFKELEMKFEELEVIQNSKAEITMEKLQLEKEMNQLKSQLEFIASEKSSNLKQTENAKQQCKENKDKINEAKLLLESTEKAFIAEQNRLELQYLEDLAAQYAHSKTSMKNDDASHLELLQNSNLQEIEQLKHETAELKLEIHNLHAEKAEIEVKYELAIENLGKLNAEIIPLKSKLQAASIEKDVREELQVLEEKHKSLELSMEELNASEKMLREEKEKLKSNLAVALDNNSNLLADNSDLQKCKIELESNILNKDKKLSEVYQYVEELTRINQKQMKSIAQLVAEKENLETDIESVHADNAQKLEQIDYLCMESTNLIQRIKNLEEQNLLKVEKLEELAAEKQNLTVGINEQKRLCVDLEAQKSKLEENITNALCEKQIAEKKVEMIKQDISICDKTKIQLERALQDMRIDNADLKQLLEKTKMNCANLENEKQKLQQKLTSTLKRIRSTDTRFSEYNVKEVEYGRKLQAQLETIDALFKEKQALEAEICMFKCDFEDVKSMHEKEIHKLEQLLKELQAKDAKRGKWHEAQLITIDTLRHDNVLFKEDLLQLKDNYKATQLMLQREMKKLQNMLVALEAKDAEREVLQQVHLKQIETLNQKNLVAENDLLLLKSNLEATHAMVEAEKESLKKMLDVLSDKVAEREELLQVQLKSIDTLSKNNTTLKNKLELFEIKYAEAQNMLQHEKENLIKLIKVLNVKETERTEFLDLIEALQIDIETLKTEHKAAIEVYQLQKQQLNDKVVNLSADLKKAKQEAQATSTCAFKYDDLLKTFLRTKIDFNEKVKRLKAALNTAQSSLENNISTCNLLQAKFNDTSQYNEDLQLEICCLQEKILDFQREILDLQIANQQITKCYNDTVEKLENLKVANNELEIKFTNALEQCVDYLTLQQHFELLRAEKNELQLRVHQINETYNKKYAKLSKELIHYKERSMNDTEDEYSNLNLELETAKKQIKAKLPAKKDDKKDVKKDDKKEAEDSRRIRIQSQLKHTSNLEDKLVLKRSKSMIKESNDRKNKRFTAFDQSRGK